MISALQKKGFDELLDMILKELPTTRRKVEVMLPFSQGALAARIRNEGAVEEEEYKPEGLYMRAIIDVALLSQVEEFLL